MIFIVFSIIFFVVSIVFTILYFTKKTKPSKKSCKKIIKCEKENKPTKESCKKIIKCENKPSKESSEKENTNNKKNLEKAIDESIDALINELDNQSVQETFENFKDKSDTKKVIDVDTGEVKKLVSEKVKVNSVVPELNEDEKKDKVNVNDIGDMAVDFLLSTKQMSNLPPNSLLIPFIDDLIKDRKIWENDLKNIMSVIKDYFTKDYKCMKIHDNTYSQLCFFKALLLDSDYKNDLKLIGQIIKDLLGNYSLNVNKFIDVNSINFLLFNFILNHFIHNGFIKNDKSHIEAINTINIISKFAVKQTNYGSAPNMELVDVSRLILDLIYQALTKIKSNIIKLSIVNKVNIKDKVLSILNLILNKIKKFIDKDFDSFNKEKLNNELKLSMKRSCYTTKLDIDNCIRNNTLKDNNIDIYNKMNELIGTVDEYKLLETAKKQLGFNELPYNKICADIKKNPDNYNNLTKTCNMCNNNLTQNLISEECAKIK